MIRAMDGCLCTIIFDMLKYFLANINQKHSVCNYFKNEGKIGNVEKGSVFVKILGKILAEIILNGIYAIKFYNGLKYSLMYRIF